MRHIGFIGLGIMGRPMAKHLLEHNTALCVNDLVQSAVDDLTTAGASALSPAEIGAACEVIFTILPNGEIVQEVLFGPGGVAETIRPGTIVCDMSSVTPEQSRRCAQLLAEKGARFLDAPVSGGEPGAIAGTLAFMVGGDKADFDELQPLFRAMGSSAVLIGPVGAGSVTKLANQVIVNLTIAAVSEGLVLATKAGADPEKVYQAIRGGLAGSAVLDAKALKIMDRDFAPGGKISINHKDIKNVLATAHDADVPLPLTAQLFEIMQALKVGGHMNDDHGGIVQFYEQLAGIQVKRREGECVCGQ